MTALRTTLRLTGLTGVTIEDLVIDTAGDGLVIEHCRDVTIARVMVNTCDGVGIRLVDSTTVSVADCAVYGYDTGSLIDGTFTGECPESRGGITVVGSRNVTLTETVLEHSNGLTLDTVDDVTVRGLHMADVRGTPLVLRGRGRRLDLGDIDVCNVMSDVPRAEQPAHVPAERPDQCA